MSSSPLQSATRRFVQKFGVAFLWASAIGGLLALMQFYRVPRVALDEVPRWHEVPRLWLERLELVSYDWRLKALGEASVRSDQVVLATLDDDTLANARVAANPALAVKPWPREIYGAVVDQTVREGASLVLLDVPLFDLSPRTCVPCKGQKLLGDDEALASVLDRHAGKLVLPFRWSNAPPRPAEREMKPWLLQAGEFATREAALPLVRDVLSARAPAYLLPSAGGYAVWAGVLNEAEGNALGARMDLKGPFIRRPETPDDAQGELGPTELLLELAAVEVEGIDERALTPVRTIEGPVAPLLATGVTFGAVSVRRDPDGIVRSFPHLFSHERDGKWVTLASAPVRAAMRLHPEAKLRYRNGRLEIGEKLSVPMDEQGQSLLAFDAAEVGRIGRGTLKRAIPLWRLWQNHEDDEAKRGVRHHDNELQNRVVVIGEDAVTRPTPIGRVSEGALLGQALVNLLHSRGITRSEPRTDAVFTLAFAFAGALLAVAYSSLRRRSGWLGYVAVLAAVGAMHAFAARNQLVSQLYWVPVAAPVLALSLTFLAAQGYAVTLERSVREFLIGTLGRALKPEQLGQVESDVGLLKPERLPVAVFFSDIEGFTALAQKSAPADLVSLLRDYLHEMTRVVIESHGHVDKYLGDGVMAFWGAPYRMGAPAETACDAALTMRKRFAARKGEWEKQIGAALHFRAGIDLGDTVVGEMGTEHRANYTVMGEPVATAARLEAIAKRFGAVIIVSEAVTEAVQGRFMFRELDLMRFARREKPMRIFELIGRATEHVDDPFFKRWETALALYRARKFDEAKTAFAALAFKDPLSARYVKRCEVLKAVPPPEKWDGVYEGVES